MKKLVTALVSAAAFAAAAGPAAADVPATYSTWNYGDGVIQTCTTPYASGAQGAFGAWGNYIDGCTVKLRCPTTVSYCETYGESRIQTESYVGHRVTLNQRLRPRTPSDAATYNLHSDRSCSGVDWCRAEDMKIIGRGYYQTVQCNGVRQTAPNRARVSCSLDVRYVY